MKNIFETDSYNEIMKRIETLRPDSQRQWGKMDVSQMLAHCSGGIEMVLGEIALNVPLIFKIMGPMFKGAVTGKQPFKKNSPTAKEFVTIGTQKDFATEKRKLTDLIKRLYDNRDNFQPHRHPFFGKMTKDDWSNLAYKHLDHHLRQFGA